MQRPLPDTMVRAIADRGYAHIGGPVARVLDLPSAGPGELLARWSLDPANAPYRREEVFLLTFPLHPLAELRIPHQVENLHGELAVYVNGFLPGPTIVPVSLLTRTRVTTDATVWRVRDGREPEPILRYQGAARGWWGGKAYLPPIDLVGPRADVDGVTYRADLAPDRTTVDLVAVQATQPAGFEPTLPNVWRRRIPIAAASKVWEASLRCTYEGVLCRVLTSSDDTLVLELQDADPVTAERLAARHVDIGVYELEALRSAVTLGDWVIRELPPSG